MIIKIVEEKNKLNIYDKKYLLKLGRTTFKDDFEKLSFILELSFLYFIETIIIDDKELNVKKWINQKYQNEINLLKDKTKEELAISGEIEENVISYNIINKADYKILLRFTSLEAITEFLMVFSIFNKKYTEVKIIKDSNSLIVFNAITNEKIDEFSFKNFNDAIKHLWDISFDYVITHLVYDDYNFAIKTIDDKSFHNLYNLDNLLFKKKNQLTLNFNEDTFWKIIDKETQQILVLVVNEEPILTFLMLFSKENKKWK